MSLSSCFNQGSVYIKLDIGSIVSCRHMLPDTCSQGIVCARRFHPTADAVSECKIQLTGSSAAQYVSIILNSGSGVISFVHNIIRPVGAAKGNRFKPFLNGYCRAANLDGRLISEIDIIIGAIERQTVILGRRVVMGEQKNNEEDKGCCVIPW